jgi:DNA polymerase-3 subunit gamma/tau
MFTEQECLMSDLEAYYRKFRPDQLKKMVGQPQAVKLISKACEKARFHHANLFAGPSGSGKTTLARIYASAVNCEDRPDGTAEPCGTCATCRSIRNGTCLDVIELDGATSGGKEEIKAVIEGGNFSPQGAARKIFIIDEAHKLSEAAMTALLKPIEEPKAAVMYILCTSEYAKIPQTITSRCQRIKFRPIPDEVVSHYVSRLGLHLSMQISDGACRQIASVSNGNMRTALNYFQSMTIASDGPITDESATEFLGLVGRQPLYELAGAIAERKTGKALDILESVLATSPDVHAVCFQLEEVFRNVMLVSAKASKGMSLSDVEAKAVAVLAEKIPALTAAEFCDNFSACYDSLERNMNQKWVLESLVTKLSEPQGS